MIIVTGGAGFIGSGIVSHLNAAGHTDIIVVDHIEPTSPKKRNLENKTYARYYEKDVFLDLIRRDEIGDPIEEVIHMGACSSTILDDEAYFQKNNFEYSCHLAQWALKHKVRFIYASSAATYGDGSRGYSDEDTITRQLEPLNFYGQSKQNFDLWVLDNGLINKVVGLKFFNVFGPNEYHKGEMQSVVAKAYKRVKEEGSISLFKSYRPEYADGQQRRDFIYVKDVVEVIDFFRQRPEVNGIFNVGTGQAQSWNDLAAALFLAVGKPLKIEYVDMPEYLKKRYQYFTEADIKKLRQAGFTRPFTSLDEAVKDYVGYLSSASIL
jgi:ADP-L-glycero-D-manno-heptose 6-epimerase